MSPNEKGRPASTGATLESTSDTRKHTADLDTSPSGKPEIDPATWSALGKPSRTDRRLKRGWRRAAR